MTNTSRDGIVRKMTVQFFFLIILNLNFTRILPLVRSPGWGGGGGVLPYMGYVGMYCYSRIGGIGEFTLV